MKKPLDFEDAPYELDFGDGWRRFRVGTCEGLWRSTSSAYDVLAVINNNPGNGHFQHVLWWFERSAKRDSKKVVFVEILNPRLGKHLEGLGYKKNGDNLEKGFTLCKNQLP